MHTALDHPFTSVIFESFGRIGEEGLDGHQMDPAETATAFDIGIPMAMERVSCSLVCTRDGILPVRRGGGYPHTPPPSHLKVRTMPQGREDHISPAVGWSAREWQG